MFDAILELIPAGRTEGWAVAALCAAVIVIGIAKSGFGGGVGILAVPLMAAAIDPGAALGVMLPILIAADVVAVAQHHRHFSGFHLGWSLLGAAVGIAFGTVVLWLFQVSESQARMLNLTVGGVCVGFVAVQVYRLLGGKVPKVPDNRRSAIGAGGLAGAVSTLAHAAGPVMTIYLLEHRLAKQRLVSTLVLFFFVVNIAKLPTYLGQGIINTQTLQASAWLILLVPVGSLIGIWLHRMVAEKPFALIMYVGALAAGARMVWKGMA